MKKLISTLGGGSEGSTSQAMTAAFDNDELKEQVRKLAHDVSNVQKVAHATQAEVAKVGMEQSSTAKKVLLISGDLSKLTIRVDNLEALLSKL